MALPFPENRSKSGWRDSISYREFRKELPIEGSALNGCIYSSLARESWRGLAFENVCFHHVEQIKKALGISGVISTSSAWLKKGVEEDGIQIDLLINRKDNVINMCELKYYGGDFTVDKDYYKILLRRTEILAKEVSPKTTVRSTLITTFGLTKNAYSSVFTNVITLDDLFA